MDWFPNYPTEYRNDTWHLSLAEHGAYKLLIDYYYQSEMSLPNNDNALASIIGVSLDEWMKAKENVLPFFQIRENKLFHKKIDEVLESQISKRKDGAARIKKYRKNKASDVTNEDVTRYTDVSNASRGEERRLEEKKEDTNVSSDFVEIWNTTFENVLPMVQKISGPREKAIKARMKDTFENDIANWKATCLQIRQSMPHLMGASGDWKATLDWCLKPANMIKILEGNYIDGKSTRNSKTPSVFAAISEIGAELHLQQSERHNGGFDQGPDTGAGFIEGDYES